MDEPIKVLIVEDEPIILRYVMQKFVSWRVATRLQQA